MPTCSPSVPWPPHDEPPLAALAEAVDAAFRHLTPADPAHLLRVAPGIDGAAVTLGLRPLTPGEHPVDALLGFTAPRQWSAVGTVTTACAGPVDGPVGQQRPVRLTFLLGRTGEPASVLAPIGRPAEAGPHRPSPATGRLVDACARALGRRTPPPQAGPGAWFEAVWLDRVVARALLEPGRAWAWADVAELHPLAESGPVPKADLLRRRTQRSSGGWEALRRRVAAGRGGSLATSLTPRWAAWFDEGSFARFAQAEAAPVDLLLDDLAALLGDELAIEVRAALAFPPPPAASGGGAGAPIAPAGEASPYDLASTSHLGEEP